jgi:hypothetical protein
MIQKVGVLVGLVVPKALANTKEKYGKILCVY